MDRLTALHVFAEVASRGSFTAVAEHLEMSRPMVTRHITALEDWLGTRLFQRTTRRVTLTDAGEQTLRRAQQILALAQEVETETTRQDGALRGQLRLTVSLSFGYAYLTTALADFLAQHPQLKIDLNISDMAVNLVEARVDLAIRISATPDPALIGRPLARCVSALVASPGYLAQHGAPAHPRDLAHHRCLSYAHFGRTEWRLSRGNETHTASVAGAFSANDALVLQQAALAGGGIAMLPTYLVGPLIQSGALQTVLPDWQVPELTIYALYTSRRQMLPAVRALLDFLVLRFADVPW